VTAPADPAEVLRDRDLGLRSLAFLSDVVGAGLAGLSAIDALLALAINQANIQPMTREPLSRIRYGALQAPAPDVRRRPVSINAVASSLRLPFETVRRRVHTLAERGVCLLGEDGVIVPEAFLASPGYMETVTTGHRRLREFFQEVRAGGWLEDLPRSAYPPEESVPIRAAVRLLSDYVLRSASALMPITGGLGPAVVLLGVAAAASAEPVSVSALARRLAIPAETVRRHAARLADLGLCHRTKEGLTLAAESFERPDWIDLFHDNAANVHRLFAGLAERGVIEAWARLAPPPTATAQLSRA
jgi:DNA-binding Lrp family transcriptional regulator